MNNKLRSYFRRVLVMLPAIPVMSFGVCLTVLGNLGADPFTSFQIGISIQTNIILGTVSTFCNAAVLFLFLFIERKLVNVATFLCAFGIGPCITIGNNILAKFIDMDAMGLPSRVIAVLLGTGLIVLGIAWYIPTNVGLQPLDILATYVGERTHKSYGFGLSVVYVVTFVLAVIMGAPWGFGTLIVTLSVGKCVDRLVPVWSPLILKLCGVKRAETAEPAKA